MYSGNASELVFDYITNNIKNGIWRPGGKIDTEEQIGSKLKVSRVAVRQVIEKLCAVDVLYKIQGSGTYVRLAEETSLAGLEYYPTTRRIMEDVLEFRKVFDANNVRLFISRAEKEDYDALETFFREIENASSEEVQDVAQIDKHFHGLIAGGTHNLIVQKIFEELSCLFVHYHTPNYDNKINRGHQMIWEAIQSKDADLAYIYCRNHTESAIDYVKKMTV